jgi:phosphohistidine phosphatase
MRLTILRHGEAIDRDAWQGEDSERPLTEDGVKRLRKVLKASKRVIKAHEIWTSPWKRARETAEMASTFWKLPLREAAWLAGGAAIAKERAEHLRDDYDVILVGHEPDLGELIGYLCGGPAVALRKAGIAVLKGEPRAGGMALSTLLGPKALLKIADD